MVSPFTVSYSLLALGNRETTYCRHLKRLLTVRVDVVSSYPLGASTRVLTTGGEVLVRNDWS